MRVSAAVLLVAGIALASPAPAQEGAAYAVATPPEAAEPAPLSHEDSALLGQALVFDPAPVTGVARPLRVPRIKEPEGFGVSRNDTPGGSTVVLKQPLPWDARIGADLGLASTPSAEYQPARPLASANDGTAGAAWASVGVTDYATLDARVDPGADQGRLAGTLKHSVPVGDRFSVTLQNSTSVTESFGTLGPSAPAGLPVMALPQDPGVPGPTQVWGNEQTVKFDVLSTGTSLSAGLASTSVDPVTHNRLSAHQKIYGPLHVTTAVTDVGQPTTNKSISAGFQLKW
ncbi:MAG: hypothetical protein ACK4UO_09455 [Pseudolabrys sp.]